MDWNTLAAVGSLCVAAITILGFWVNFSNRIEAAANTAQSAEREARLARETANALNTAFGLYREQVASEYIHRETMREVETRMTAALERLGDRLDRFLQQALDYKRGVID